MLKSMEIKEGVGVFMQDGEQVGKVNRFVLNPGTNEVTHIVVQKGWLLPEDKVVPLSMISSATPEKVILTSGVGDFSELPPFEEEYFVRAMDDADEPSDDLADEKIPTYYWYPPRVHPVYPPFTLDYYPWLPLETKRNIPEETIPLRDGAQVISSDGKHVGSIERLLIEPSFNRATHLVIKHGTLLKERRILPTYWVGSVEEDKVYLLVSSKLVNRLPLYEK